MRMHRVLVNNSTAAHRFQFADISVTAQHALFIRLSFIEALKIEILLQYQIIGFSDEASIPKRMIIASAEHIYMCVVGV